MTRPPAKPTAAIRICHSSRTLRLGTEPVRATAHDQDDAFYNGIVDAHVRGQPRPPGDESEDVMQMLDEADFTLHVRGFSHNELRAALGGDLRGSAPA